MSAPSRPDADPLCQQLARLADLHDQAGGILAEAYTAWHRGDVALAGRWLDALGLVVAALQLELIQPAAVVPAR